MKLLLPESQEILDKVKKLVLTAEDMSYSELEDNLKSAIHAILFTEIKKEIDKLTFYTKG